jgi:hypothetical protein
MIASTQRVIAQTEPILNRGGGLAPFAIIISRSIWTGLSRRWACCCHLLREGVVMACVSNGHQVGRVASLMRRGESVDFTGYPGCGTHNRQGDKGKSQAWSRSPQLEGGQSTQ